MVLHWQRDTFVQRALLQARFPTEKYSTKIAIRIKKSIFNFIKTSRLTRQFFSNVNNNKFLVICFQIFKHLVVDCKFIVDRKQDCHQKTQELNSSDFGQCLRRRYLSTVHIPEIESVSKCYPRKTTPLSCAELRISVRLREQAIYFFIVVSTLWAILSCTLQDRSHFLV